jgi:DNA-binding winged helix-turn-helix (wHTH) protein
MQTIAMNELSVSDNASGETDGLTIQTDNVVAPLDSGAVSVNERPIRLTRKERCILELLILLKGKTLTREALVDHLYESIEKPEVKIIDVFVCKLRKKLAEATPGDHYIETVWGRGYAIRYPHPAANRLVQVQSDVGDIVHLGPSPMREAPVRSVRHNPRDMCMPRDGPPITQRTSGLMVLRSDVALGSKTAVAPTAGHSRFTFNCGRTVALLNPSVRASAQKQLAMVRKAGADYRPNAWEGCASTWW